MVSKKNTKKLIRQGAILGATYKLNSMGVPGPIAGALANVGVRGSEKLISFAKRKARKAYQNYRTSNNKQIKQTKKKKKKNTQ